MYRTRYGHFDYLNINAYLKWKLSDTTHDFTVGNKIIYQNITTKISGGGGEEGYPSNTWINT